MDASLVEPMCTKSVVSRCWHPGKLLKRPLVRRRGKALRGSCFPCLLSPSFVPSHRCYCFNVDSCRSWSTVDYFPEKSNVEPCSLVYTEFPGLISVKFVPFTMIKSGHWISGGGWARTTPLLWLLMPRRLCLADAPPNIARIFAAFSASEGFALEETQLPPPVIKPRIPCASYIGILLLGPLGGACGSLM